MSHDTDAVEAVFDHLKESAVDQQQISVGDITDALGSRTYGPFLFVPAMFALSPLGGIPGFPTILAAIILVFSVQIVWGRDRMWVPDILRRRAIDADKIVSATDTLTPVARWLDRWFPGRLSGAVGATARRLAALISLLLCLAVPPFELVPFAATVPMGAVALFGLAITLRDGVLMCLGFALSAMAATTIVTLL